MRLNTLATKQYSKSFKHKFKVINQFCLEITLYKFLRIVFLKIKTLKAPTLSFKGIFWEESNSKKFKGIFLSLTLQLDTNESCWRTFEIYDHTQLL